jgi:putative oxidoreductase
MRRAKPAEKGGISMTDGLLLLGRILLSLIFIMFGVGKLTTMVATQAMMEKLGLPFPMLAWLVTVVVEVGGGLALLFGIWTRQVAVVLGVWCIATALVAHTNFADRNMQIHFTKNLAMAGGFIYVAVFGAGNFSFDGWRKRGNS